jgi:hypothetical protein
MVPFRLARTALSSTSLLPLMRIWVSPAGATLVVYAAMEGTIAKDGDDSPFAVSFARRIVERGVEINKALRFVRQDVPVTTGNEQEPFVYGSLPPNDFYFVPPK